MEAEVVELAVEAARSVLGQAVLNLLEADRPVTNEAMVDELSRMFEDSDYSRVAELAMFMFGVSKH